MFKGKKQPGIYIGWLGKENLGDEAMWNVCQSVFSDVRWTIFSSLQYETKPGAFVSRAGGDLKQWGRMLKDELQTRKRLRSTWDRMVHRMAAGNGGPVALFGGGTLINDRDMLSEYEATRRMTKKPVPVFGSGVADPEFWTGRSGFSDQRKQWAGALAELPVVGVRGPRSKALLEECGLGNVIISGDPAVVLHEPLVPAEPSRRIGINCGNAKQTSGNVDGAQLAIANAAKEWIRQGYKIELFPVWPPDIASCTEVAKLIGDPAVEIAPLQASTTEYLSWVKRFDVVVAIKLHAAILAAAANVPFVLLEYQPKCRDFGASIGWDKFIIKLQDTSGISELVSGLLKDKQKYAELLCTHMCELKRTFLSYCDAIHPFLKA